MKLVVREASRGPGPLQGALKVLADLKRAGLIKEYALGGGVGAMRYTEPFTTVDLDVFYVPISGDLAAGLPAMYAYLRERGFEPAREYVVIAGIPVQFLAVDALTREAVESATEVDYEGAKTRICSAEHLLAMAARTGRPRDRLRMAMLLEQGKINRLKLAGILKRHGLAVAFAAATGKKA